jgi:hypothetical protein
MVRGDQELNHDGGEVLSPLHFLPKQQLRCHDGSRQSAFQIARASATQTEKEPILKTSVFSVTRKDLSQFICSSQRTLAVLTERLDLHRGAGQQSITVKHVTVNADNAIVGDVNQAPGGGSPAEIKGQPHALGHAIQPTLWSENPQREPVPVAGDAERSLPDARRPISGRPERE